MECHLRYRDRIPGPASTDSDLVKKPSMSSKPISSNVKLMTDGVDHAERFKTQQAIVESFIHAICGIVGVIVMLASARFVMWYLEMLHENLLFFSSIREVEREISFRTEQGLYYSYYKQLVSTPSFLQALRDLEVDNATEHGHTINIIQRFNIHQEVFLAAIYKLFNMQGYVEPIIFYTRFVFLLQAVLAVGIFSNSWLMGRSWLAGLLSICWFVSHKNDSTRVNYSIPLRESFSVPFIFCQMAVVSLYLKHRISACQQITSLVGIIFFTFLYTVTWQFSQFVTLMQVAAVYLLASVNQISKHKVLQLYLVHTSCLLTTCVLQYGNTMLLSSFALSLIPVAAVSLVIQGRLFHRGVLANIQFSLLNIAATFIASILLNWFIKLLLSDGSDQHIFKFVKAKLGLEDLRDFESRLYLCNEAFKFMDYNTFSRLFGGFLLPLFCFTLLLWTSHIIYRILVSWEFAGSKEFFPLNIEECYPVLSYHAVQTVLYALLAVTTMRMKCLWVPHVCIVAASGVTHPLAWTKMGGWFSSKSHILRRAAALAIIAYLIHLLVPFVYERMDDLNEFWDPDTVELMEFIKVNTPKTAAFAGSMQLLAGIKLCTGRPITNHPHFEDWLLRKRTLQIYQMYAKQPPETVYDLLRSVDASYIVMEDSICLTPTEDHCHLVDILDLNNGHVPDIGDPKIEGLSEAQSPRFCDEIRHGGQHFSSFFKAVFINRTFRVYQMLSKQRTRFQ